MSVIEMKKMLIDIVEKQDDEKKLQKMLSFLGSIETRDISAEEVFERMSARYDNTLRKLAQ